MSLLQEALKRKEDEEAQRKPETGSAEKVSIALPSDGVSLHVVRRKADDKNTIIPQDTPPQSMPVLAPPRSAASQPAHRSLGAGGPILASAEPLARSEASERGEVSERAKPGRQKALWSWMVVAAIAILTGLTVAIGYVFLIYRRMPPEKVTVSQQTDNIGKTDTIAAAGTNTVIAQPIHAASTEAMTHQVVAPDAKDVKKDLSVAAALTQTSAVTQNAELNTGRPQSAGDIAPKPVSIKPTPFRIKALTASSAAGRWPALKLTGILRGSGPTESTALINGKMISAGQMIDNVTIVEIQANGVLLKHGAEKRFLRVGATSY